jgi:ABC-type transporter Mla MlaB component
MLRITHRPVTEVTDAPLRLRLEGQVRGPWVPELRRVCAAAGPGADRLELDLTGVTFVDAAGVSLFRELVSNGALVFNCSPFIAEQLRGIADAAR